MRFNHFDSTILGINITGQGSTNAVEGAHRAMLRDLIAKFARRLSLRLASWHALKRMPAAMSPALAICPSYLDARQTRQSAAADVGVVETRGTVGVC